MTKKAIIITSVITVSIGSIAFYFLYWRKRAGVSQADKPVLEQATQVQLNTQPLPPVTSDVLQDNEPVAQTQYQPLSSTRDQYGDRDLKSSTIQGPIKIS